MIQEKMSNEHWWNDANGENWSPCTKLVPVPLCPSQNPHGLTKYWTQESTVRGQWLTASAVAWQAYYQKLSNLPGALQLEHQMSSFPESILLLRPGPAALDLLPLKQPAAKKLTYRIKKVPNSSHGIEKMCCCIWNSYCVLSVMFCCIGNQYHVVIMFTWFILVY